MSSWLHRLNASFYLTRTLPSHYAFCAYNENNNGGSSIVHHVATAPSASCSLAITVDTPAEGNEDNVQQSLSPASGSQPSPTSPGLAEPLLRVPSVASHASSCPLSSDRPCTPSFDSESPVDPHICCDSSRIPTLLSVPRAGTLSIAQPFLSVISPKFAVSRRLSVRLFQVSLFSLSYINCRIGLRGTTRLSNTHAVPLVRT